MPPSVPPVPGAEAVRRPQRLGFVVARQKGSHVVLKRDGAGCVVPLHDELKAGTLAGVLRQAGVSADEFLKAR
jgi:predicted RNA binding protein YcfA (HicA-like mRNA interferase family)